MSDSRSVTAVIVTWNSASYIRKCLDSLICQTAKVERIIVVDNASSDDTAAIIRADYPMVQLIVNETNAGFAGGNNQAIQTVETDWVLALNPDAYITPDFLQILLSFAENDLTIGTLGGALLKDSDPPTAEPVVDSLGIDIYRSRNVVDRGAGQVWDGTVTDPYPVFGVCAAVALYRKRMLDDTAINGEYFPSAFFAYLEDVDLSWRAWRRGWSAWIVPTAIGWHVRNGSPTGSRFSRELIHRNRYWLIARNEPLTAVLRNLPSVLGYELFLLLKTVKHLYLIKSYLQAFKVINRFRHARSKLPSRINCTLPFTSDSEPHLRFAMGKRHISSTMRRKK